MKLILVSLLIATPVSGYLMREWLKGFAYRIDVGWMVFAMTGLFAILIALLTIAVQAVKAGLSNPVKSLRTE